MDEEDYNPYRAPESTFEKEEAAYEPTGTPNLDVQYVFTTAHEIFKENIGTTMAMFVIYYGIAGAMSAVLNGAYMVAMAAGLSELALLGINLGGTLVSTVVQAPILVGISLGYALIARGAKPEISVLFRGFNRFGESVGLYLLYMLIVLLGMFVLFVPGVILAIGLYMCLYLFPEKQLGIVDSLKASWELTKGYKGQLFLVFLVGFVVNVVGVCALCIGALYTMPLSLLAYAVCYNELLKRGVRIEESGPTI